MTIRQLPTIAVAVMTIAERANIVALLESIGAVLTTDENDYIRCDFAFEGGATILVRFDDDLATSAIVSTGGEPIIPAVFVSAESKAIVNKDTLSYFDRNAMIKRLRKHYQKALDEKSLESLPEADDMVRVMYITDEDDGRIGTRFGKQGTKIGDFQKYDTGTSRSGAALIVAVV